MTESERQMQQLHAYHDGELGAIGRWRVRRMLAKNPKAAEELQGFAALGDLLREGEAEAVLPDLWPGIEGRLPRRTAAEAEVEETREPWMPRWAPAGLAAAAVALVIAVGLGGGDGPDVHSVRWLDAGGRSAAVLQDDSEATIIWIQDAADQSRTGGGHALI